MIIFLTFLIKSYRLFRSKMLQKKEKEKRKVINLSIICTLLIVTFQNVCYQAEIKMSVIVNKVKRKDLYLIEDAKENSV